PHALPPAGRPPALTIAQCRRLHPTQGCALAFAGLCQGTAVSKQVTRPEQPAWVSSLPPMPDVHPGPSCYHPPCLRSVFQTGLVSGLGVRGARFQKVPGTSVKKSHRAARVPPELTAIPLPQLDPPPG
ncbi:hypothetical protein LEMLEM_LOCUS25709, partial [Lemmus lemmus]